MSGTVEHIHIADRPGAPVRPLSSVAATPRGGLAGDRNAKPPGAAYESSDSCDLTLIEAEKLEELEREHGIELAPGESRRNITTRGIRLNDLVGREFWVGDVLARGVELCEPCSHLQSLLGKPIIKPLIHKAGLRADVLSGGTISIGDSVRPRA